MTTLTFDVIKKRIGKNTKYYSDTDGWKTGRGLTEQDIEDYVNEIYLEELFPTLATHFPEVYRQTGTADSWIASGTAAAGLTGSTITATSGIFTNGMIGLYLWNDTDSGKTKITAYTSATEVTVESDDVSDWSGDSLYVLGSEFTFGGNATDIYVLESVGLKYETTSDYFVQTDRRNFFDFYQEGGEVGNSARPIIYLTTVNVSGTPTSGVGIIPAFDAKIEKAVLISYIGIPAAMSNASDLPRVPTASALISGGTAKAFEKIRMFKEASYWNTKYKIDKRDTLSHYRIHTTILGGAKIRPSRRLGQMINRYI